MRTLLLLAVFAIAAVGAGCSSSSGNKPGHRGELAELTRDAGHVPVGHALGHASKEINLYSITTDYQAADVERKGAWRYAHTSCRCHAYNRRTGRFKHELVFYGPSHDPTSSPAPHALIRHECLHSYIESSPEHGGAPLPAERRRGDHSHPTHIYVNGRWQKCSDIINGRWPARMVNSVAWLVPGGRSPLEPWTPVWRGEECSHLSFWALPDVEAPDSLEDFNAPPETLDAVSRISSAMGVHEGSYFFIWKDGDSLKTSVFVDGIDPADVELLIEAAKYIFRRSDGDLWVTSSGHSINPKAK